MKVPRRLIPVAPLAFIPPGTLFRPEQRASGADRDTAVDTLRAAVAEGRLSPRADKLGMQPDGRDDQGL